MIFLKQKGKVSQVLGARDYGMVLEGSRLLPSIIFLEQFIIISTIYIEFLLCVLDTLYKIVCFKIAMGRRD